MIVAIVLVAIAAAIALVAIVAPGDRSDPGRLFVSRRSPAAEEAARLPIARGEITWPRLLGFEDLDEDERFDVVRTLGAVDLPAVPAAIRQALIEEVDPQLRELLLEAAGCSKAPELLEIVEASVSAQDARERRLAEVALCRIRQFVKS